MGFILKRDEIIEIFPSFIAKILNMNFEVNFLIEKIIVDTESSLHESSLPASIYKLFKILLKINLKNEFIHNAYLH